MKQLTCEMCGSTDLMKQDGVFVCQTCGTKYSVEEAKKMMVEGTVDVTGSTVKVDTSGELANLYQIARRAKDDNNGANAAKYYDMVLMKDPSSWEAYFYSIYYKAINCKIAEITSAANSVANCISSVFSLIKENITDEEDRKSALGEVCDKAFQISEMLKSAADNYYDNIDESIRERYWSERIDQIGAAGAIKRYICDNLCRYFIDDSALIIGIPYLKMTLYDGVREPRRTEWLNAVHKFEPDYDISKREKELSDNLEKVQKELMDTLTKASKQSSAGCYVATAVYGSYDCPQVWTLRRFRDYTLAETWYGRAFIRTYYAISPTLVKWFGHTEWFKKMWKGRLDRMVANLNAEGVEDTPYVDQEW